MHGQLDAFERHRCLLRGLADRMLGSLADAEDVVQETFLRWRAVDPAAIDSPRAWLVTTCSRLAIDELRAARRGREAYPGPWLPEPMVDAPPPSGLAELNVRGARRVARLLAGVIRKQPVEIAWSAARVNHRPGRVLVHRDRVVALSIEWGAAGRIAQVSTVRNPDKLRACAAGPA